MVRWNLAPAAVTAAILLLGTSAGDLRTQLDAAAARYYANLARVAPIAGRDTTFDYYQRLRQDADGLPDHDSEMLRRTATLDLSLTDQLLSGHYRALSEIRGLGEALIHSSRDGTMQPAAVYVPTTYSSNRPASLLVLLHGADQSETNLLSAPYITQLAEANGTIVIAPWGHGYVAFRGSAPDIYDALHAAVAAFAIDPHQKYLGGYSMGGFAVFRIAPLHPDEWAGIMSIAGGLMNPDAAHVVTALRGKTFYILTGSDDQVIPTQYPSATAGFLSSQGFSVSFYSQPGGEHWLNTLVPILSEAWSDMLHRITRVPPPELGRLMLPGVGTASPTKP